jgi:hypothetical protein
MQGPYDLIPARRTLPVFSRERWGQSREPSGDRIRRHKASCDHGPFSQANVRSGREPLAPERSAIAPVRAKLSLKASRYVVQPNTSVTFTASISPTTVGNGLSISWSRSWRWVPDGGGTPQTCGSAETCMKTITASGTMFVDGVINTEQQTASVHIRVINCLTGDSLLDSLPILDALKTDMDSSGFPGSDILNRRERKSGIYCDGGVCIRVLYPPEQGDGPCSTTFPDDHSPTLIGQTHAHPFRPYNPNPGASPPGTFDTIPDICKDSLHQGKTTAAGFGPSDPDYDHVGGTGIPQWIIDPDSIYFIPGIPGSTPADKAARVNGKKSWGRKVGSCTRV